MGFNRASERIASFYFARPRGCVAEFHQSVDHWRPMPRRCLRGPRGQPRKALDLYRRAFERGARTPKLREWIDTKDRLLGGSAQ